MPRVAYDGPPVVLCLPDGRLNVDTGDTPDVPEDVAAELTARPDGHWTAEKPSKPTPTPKAASAAKPKEA